MEASDGAGGEDDVRAATAFAQTVDVEAEELGGCRGELGVDALRGEPGSVWAGGLRGEAPRGGGGRDGEGPSGLEELSALKQSGFLSLTSNGIYKMVLWVRVRSLTHAMEVNYL